MHKTIMTSAAILVAACGADPVETGPDARAAFNAYVEAINAGEAETAGAMYDDAPGFHWIEDGRVRYASADEAAESLAALNDYGGSPALTVDEVKVASMGDEAALISAHFDMAMMKPDGTAMFRYGGWMSLGMVHREDGWKIAAGQTGPDGAD